MFDLNDGPVIRINQAGYAEGLPVYAAILTKGLVELKDEAGNILPFEAAPLKLDEAVRAVQECAEEKGVLYGTGVYQPGEIKKSSVFKQAYEMGKTVR